MSYKYIEIPSEGEKISFKKNKLLVPDNPIITYIEGDGIGVDITPVMQKVVDSAVKIAYSSNKKIHWMEIYAGEKANRICDNQWLPEETLSAIKEYVISIKGPLATAVGTGIRSLNVSIRQQLDLYICQRPVQYFSGTPSPVKHPEKIDMTIFRENSEDIYAGIEYQADSNDAKKIISFLEKELNVNKIRFNNNCGIGIKPVSKEGTQRLVKAAIKYAIDNNKNSVTLVHKGNIMKFTEGAFRDWGYELAIKEFKAKIIGDGPWCAIKNPNNGEKIIIKDVIADAFLQQIILRPEDYAVIATLNLNGDYISDALAAQVGGIGIAPGANLSDTTAVFEATHGTAPKYAGQDKVNPSSIILSAAMMLRHMGWTEAADMVIKGISKTIQNKTVTYDLERLVDGAKLLSCSEFGDAIIENL